VNDDLDQEEVESESKVKIESIEAEELQQEDAANNSEEFKKIFTKKSQFKEFIRFIKNGFKIK
jgi:hypothetical protein